MTASLGPCMDGMLCASDQREGLGYYSTERCTNLRPPSLSSDSSIESQTEATCMQPLPCQAPLPPTSFLGHAHIRAPPSCFFARPLLCSVAPPPAPLATPPLIGSSLGRFSSLSSQPSLPPISPALSWLLPLSLRPLYSFLLLVVLSPAPLCPPSLLLQLLPLSGCPCPPTHNYPVPTPPFLNFLSPTSWWSFPQLTCPTPSR